MSSKRLFACIGEVSDSFLKEVEAVDFAARKRIAKYSTVAAAASLGVAVTFWLIRSKRVRAS